LIESQRNGSIPNTDVEQIKKACAPMSDGSCAFEWPNKQGQDSRREEERI